MKNRTHHHPSSLPIIFILISHPSLSSRPPPASASTAPLTTTFISTVHIFTQIERPGLKEFEYICTVAAAIGGVRPFSAKCLVISKDGGRALDLLILDSNAFIVNRSSSTHFHFLEALDAVKRICPKRALLTGMTHDYDHEKINMCLYEWSEREGIPVQLAHDGLRVPMEL